MKITENIFMAVKNLRNNKARSFLTMLGIIIGVGAVITMVSLGEGARRQITQQISQMGSNLIMVTPGRNGNNAINNDIVTLLQESVDHVRAIAPVVRGSVLAEAQDNSMDTAVIGCTPEYAVVRNYQVAFGQFIGTEDYKDRRKVAVIGAELAAELYPGINPIGETIKVDGVRLEIIGILAQKGQGGFDNTDNVIMLPLTTAQDRIFGNKNISEISLEVTDAARVNETYQRVKEVLLEELEDEDLYHVNNMAEMLSAAQNMMRIMTLLLAGIAGISLLVGGIGIMNIMLVSVTERIREIGIRKAIGAQPEEILTMFMIEAVTLSIIGGLAGIIWGGALALVIGRIIGWSITVSFSAVSIAFTFSLLVGLFFGVYPAYKASGLNPIEALRHE